LAKPVVDGIEREAPARVVRVNTLDGAGRELASRYGVRAVPTLIVFDGEGDEALRLVGRVRREIVVETLARLGARS
jgi:thioredoxin-related protein